MSDKKYHFSKCTAIKRGEESHHVLNSPGAKQDLIILFAEVRKLKPLGSLSSYMEELGFDPRSV